MASVSSSNGQLTSWRLRSFAIAELDDLATVALAGTAFGCGREILQGFAIFNELHAQLAAGVGFAIKGLSDSGRAADGTEGKDLDLKLMCFGLDLQQIAKMNFASRFGRLVIGLNSAQVTGAGSESSSLEEACGPEPFVDANAGHGSIVAQKERIGVDHRFSQGTGVDPLPHDRLSPSLVGGKEDQLKRSQAVKEQPHFFHDWHIERMEQADELAASAVKFCELPGTHNRRNACRNRL